MWSSFKLICFCGCLHQFQYIFSTQCQHCPITVHKRLEIMCDSLEVHQPFRKHHWSFVPAAIVAKVTQDCHHSVSFKCLLTWLYKTFDFLCISCKIVTTYCCVKNMVEKWVLEFVDLHLFTQSYQTKECKQCNWKVAFTSYVVSI